MGKDSSIQWTTHTFNPWRGCTRVSEGCRNCYAETLSRRNPKVLGVWGQGGTRVIASEANWSQVAGWDRVAGKAGVRHRVFCASLADVFEDWQGSMVNSVGESLWIEPRDPRESFLVCQNRNGSYLPHECFRPLTMDDVRRRLFRKILATPNLDWLLLTKRPENITRLWPVGHEFTGPGSVEWPNLWLGTTVENANVLHRVDILRRIPAAIRFLSVEPMLDGIDRIDLEGIHWVIVGGESGGHARPFDLAWARSIRDQAHAAGAAFFMKQLGADPFEVIRANNHHVLDRDYLGIKDSHGGDWDEWDQLADLRVREFPRSEAARA